LERWKKNELEFANFILKFGQDRNLLDFISEIVLPAFTEKLEWTYGETIKHFFHDAELINLGDEENPIICIVGRYVKNTIVVREQFYNEESNTIIKDNRSLPTSPTSIFVLILNNHRLLYLGESSKAPSLYEFQKTALKFLKEKYQDFIDAQGNLNPNVPRNQIYRQYPAPSLEIVSLTGEGSLREFIGRYDLLKMVEIKLLSTNNEADNNGFFDAARKIKDEANSETTTIRHQNSQGGLSKVAVTQQVESAIGQGNSKIRLDGRDRQGNTLKGNNETFKVSSYLHEPPKTISGIARKAYEVFEHLATEGIIRIGERREDISRVIQQLSDQINSKSEDNE
jgi:hypothetical protein